MDVGVSPSTNNEFGLDVLLKSCSLPISSSSSGCPPVRLPGGDYTIYIKFILNLIAQMFIFAFKKMWPLWFCLQRGDCWCANHPLNSRIARPLAVCDAQCNHTIAEDCEDKVDAVYMKTSTLFNNNTIMWPLICKDSPRDTNPILWVTFNTPNSIQRISQIIHSQDGF